MDEFLGRAFSSSLANWLTFLVALVSAWRLVPAVLGRVLEGRRDNARHDSLLLDRYEKRFVRLEENEEQCQRDLAGALKRIAELEGYNIGRGEARQEAQLLDSKGQLGKPKPDRG